MQQTIQHILVPVDFGAAALRAVTIAITIAKMNRAQIHLLHIIENSDNAGAMSATDGLQTETQLAAWLADAVHHTFELNPVCIQAEGIPHVVINNWLKLNLCDLVVMGMYGRHADGALQIGSTAYEVIKHNACPVLLMPATGTRNHFLKTLYATRPYSGSMAALNFVKCLMWDNAIVEIFLFAPLSESQGRSINWLLYEEASEALETINAEWNSHLTPHGLPLAHELVMAVQHSGADLLVLTPSLARENRLGYVAPEIRDLLKDPQFPILYLINNTLHYKHT